MIGPGRFARGVVVLALLGATVGVGLDGLHSHFGKTVYTHPVFWRMAWWVPLLFAGAFMLGLGRPLLERVLGAAGPMPSAAGTAAAFAAFIMAYVVTILPIAWPLVAALLFIIFAISWWFFDRSPAGLVISLLAGFGGPAFESFLVGRGLFVHLQVLAFGVPGWLPFLYLVAGVALTTLAKRLVDAENQSSS
jgi:voltage-gated potassium channel Kch